MQRVCSLIALTMLAVLGTVWSAIADSTALSDTARVTQVATGSIADSGVQSTLSDTSTRPSDAAASAPDSVASARVVVVGPDTTPTAAAKTRRCSPLLAGSASALVPGLGQIYARRYVKGGLFLATEAIMGLVAYNRYVEVVNSRRDESDAASAMVPFRSIRDSLAQFLPINTNRVVWNQQHSGWSDSLFLDDSTRFMGSFVLADSVLLFARLDHDRALFERHYSEKLFYHSVGWMGGCYVFNILDALQSTGRFRDERPRKPAVAGWLSAIPGLGLGQWYNGSLSKAGMILMTQGSMALMAYNYNSLMHECSNKLLELRDPASPAHQFEGSFAGTWTSRQKSAERMRNTYLWYSLLFYFYGVFDAVVDAHLHDAPSKMRLEPDLGGGKRAGARANFSF